MEATKLLTKREGREHFLLHWSRKFKELCTINLMGVDTMILLHSYELIKKLFVQHADCFSNRPKDRWLTHRILKGKGNKS